MTLLFGVISGCEEPSEEPEISPDVQVEAQAIFAARCATCHGTTGAGDGPGAAALDPRPRNMQDPAWQRSVDDQRIERAIVYGGAAVGLSAGMPPNPDLQSKPEVVSALRRHVRELGGGRVATAETR